MDGEGRPDRPDDRQSGVHSSTPVTEMDAACNQHGESMSEASSKPVRILVSGDHPTPTLTVLTYLNENNMCASGLVNPTAGAGG
jgi:hypothetical protein